jgi:hypothetical protein
MFVYNVFVMAIDVIHVSKANNGPCFTINPIKFTPLFYQENELEVQS